MRRPRPDLRLLPWRSCRCSAPTRAFWFVVAGRIEDGVGAMGSNRLRPAQRRPVVAHDPGRRLSAGLSRRIARGAAARSRRVTRRPNSTIAPPVGQRAAVEFPGLAARRAGGAQRAQRAAGTPCRDADRAERHRAWSRPDSGRRRRTSRLALIDASGEVPAEPCRVSGRTTAESVADPAGQPAADAERARGRRRRRTARG